ncbi:hypothetical protein GMSM_08040 [Geomonas sp. Red276]
MIYRIKRRIAALADTFRRASDDGYDQEGFSLVEMVVVVAIIAILASLAIPAYSQIEDLARNARAVVEIREMEHAIAAYSIEHGGVYPSSLADIGRPNAIDPWGARYVYSDFKAPNDAPRLGSIGSSDDQWNTDFDLYSLGTDGNSNAANFNDPSTQNDLIRAGNGAYCGLAKDF